MLLSEEEIDEVVNAEMSELVGSSRDEDVETFTDPTVIME